MKSSLLLAGAGALVLSGMVACGMPGVPQPPSLELPRAVQDLRAVRKGDRVFLAWTTPRQATDHSAIRHMGVTRICRVPNQVAAVECRETAGLLGPSQTRPSAPATFFVDTLPVQLLEQRGFVSYAVEVQNSHGRSAGLSNQVIVPLAAISRSPLEVHAAVTADGVRVEWRGDPPGNAPDAAGTSGYEVYRQPTDAPEQAPRTDLGAGDPQLSATAGGMVPYTFLDRTAEWEKPYRYTVAPLTHWSAAGTAGSFEGDEVTIQVTPHDIFPPAPPLGLQAVAAGTLQQPVVDLSWTPNRESDLAGYNLYRREENAPLVKINPELVNAPVYGDANVQAGHRYWYAVTAVDVRGNESGKSTEASELVPR